ncbi:MarR family transcriptional regulator [Streptomyces sp. V4-01]|uniref:MarR family transcriptional regulator n=1 Tax=Actinacidiphila polyblastidii TaxID=3110430 RepID=A0ABU7P3P5_9ACTN|nr:MarR family transcriptional regulator [Streptomyces sp. V4-01]
MAQEAGGWRHRASVVRDHGGPSPQSADLAARTGEIIELLEILWERRRDISPAPVSAAQLRVLYILEREECLNLGGLAVALGASAPSTSRLCDRLEALGFVARSPNEANRREKDLRLAEAGRAHLRQLRLWREAELQKTIAAMPPEAQVELLRGIQAFRTASLGAPRASGEGSNAASA